MARQKRQPYINAAPMADIAFLLLIFFLVTTTIASDKGIALLLPPKPDPNIPPPEFIKNQRNIFKILVNSSNKVLVEDEPLTDYSKIRIMVKDFVLNFGKISAENDQLILTLSNSQQKYVRSSLRKSDSSDSPTEAVVSFKTDRGTNYDIYLAILDEVMGAYNEIYGERIGLTAEEFRNLDQKEPSQKSLYDLAREGIPRNVSIAEPSKVGGN
ncbi:MAG TPA: biopolymer transporter ExbD [Cyclobacteriaceae bacterium]|nr:biopolymer transporter ExbD [Cyclobacteriaceae bacterium]